MYFCVWPISPSQYDAFCVSWIIELVCILRYKLNKSYLCLTHGQFSSSLIHPLSTTERITGVVDCLHHEIRKSSNFLPWVTVFTTLIRLIVMSGRNPTLVILLRWLLLLARLAELIAYPVKSCVYVCLHVCLCVNHGGPSHHQRHTHTCNPALVTDTCHGQIP